MTSRDIMDNDLDKRIRERAYHLWQKEGQPDGRREEFWERARLLEEAASAPPPTTPLQSRTAEEAAVDEAMAETFPASDPPAFTAEVGTGRATAAKPAKRGKAPKKG